VVSVPSSATMRYRPTWAKHVPGPHEPLPARLEEFLGWLRVQNRPDTTVRAYRQDLAKFAAFRRDAGNDIACGLDRAVLRRYQVELAAVLPNPRTRQRALVALRSFLRFACDEGWVDRDLSGTVTLPRFVQGDPHPVRTEDVPALLAALPRRTLRDQRDRALIHLLISTGCRISEACALDRDDVRGDSFRVLGKGGKRRSVYLTPDARAAVEEYLTARGDDACSALFINLRSRRGRRDRRLAADGARAALRVLRQRAPAVRLLRSPHAARHTTATMLMESGADLRTVQEILGHATMETLRSYTEVTDTRKRAAYDRLSEQQGVASAPDDATKILRLPMRNLVPAQAEHPEATVPPILMELFEPAEARTALRCAFGVIGALAGPYGARLFNVAVATYASADSNPHTIGGQQELVNAVLAELENVEAS